MCVSFKHIYFILKALKIKYEQKKALRNKIYKNKNNQVEKNDFMKYLQKSIILKSLKIK